MAQLYPGHVRGLFITLPVPALTAKHYVQLGLAHFLTPSILLDFDEQEFLGERFNAKKYLGFLW